MQLLEVLRDLPMAKFLPLTNWCCVYVQHLLISNYRCVEFLESLGLDRRRLLVFGKGYSTSQTALATYRNGNYAVHDRTSDFQFSEPFDDAIIRQVELGIQSLLDAGETSILIIDEGGIAMRAVDNLRLESSLRIAFAELTSRGTQHYALVSGKFPLVDVANSFLKKRVESRVIVTSMLECLARELNRLNLAPLASGSIGIIGYGAIGGEIYRQLSVLGSRPLRYDLQGNRSDFVGVVDAMQRSSVVLSSTGGGLIGLCEFLEMEGSKIFVNCGSSDVEFNLWQVATELGSFPNSKGSFVFESPPWEGPAVLGLPRSVIRFLRGGFPINFDGSPDPISAEKIQLTRAALIGGALQSIGLSLPGIYELDSAVQSSLLASFNEIA